MPIHTSATIDLTTNQLNLDGVILASVRKTSHGYYWFSVISRVGHKPDFKTPAEALKEALKAAAKSMGVYGHGYY